PRRVGLRGLPERPGAGRGGLPGSPGPGRTVRADLRTRGLRDPGPHARLDGPRGLRGGVPGPGPRRLRAPHQPRPPRPPSPRPGRPRVGARGRGGPGEEPAPAQAARPPPRACRSTFRWWARTPMNPARKPLIKPDTAWFAALAAPLDGMPTTA